MKATKNNNAAKIQASTPVEAEVALTPAQIEERTSLGYQSILKGSLNNAQRSLETFKERLAANPGDAFEWSAAAFTAAAALEVAGYALKCLEQGAKPQDVIAELLHRALRTGGSSTSAAANLMTHERQQVAARLYEQMAGIR